MTENKIMDKSSESTIRDILNRTTNDILKIEDLDIIRKYLVKTKAAQIAESQEIIR